MIAESLSFTLIVHTSWLVECRNVRFQSSEATKNTLENRSCHDFAKIAPERNGCLGIWAIKLNLEMSHTNHWTQTTLKCCFIQYNKDQQRKSNVLEEFMLWKLVISAIFGTCHHAFRRVGPTYQMLLSLFRIWAEHSQDHPFKDERVAYCSR